MGGVPRITHRFYDSPEGPTGPGKVILIVTVYDSKAKQSKEKGTQGAVQGKLGQAASCPLPMESHRQHLFFPAVACGNTREVLPAREAHPNLDVQGSNCRWQGMPP